MILIELGRTRYDEAYKLMKELVERRIKGECGDLLLLTEHEHVFTIGRKGSEANVLERIAPLYKIERGGDVTYHGPGMLIAYPIIKLDERGLDVKRLVWALEEVVISSFKEFGVEAERRRGYPGVWIGEKKLASIGLALSGWVTYHGLAVNVSPDMRYFRAINPCGLPSHVISSLSEVLGRTVTLDEYVPLFVKSFEEVFGVKLLRKDLKEVKTASI